MLPNLHGPARVREIVFVYVSRRGALVGRSGFGRSAFVTGIVGIRAKRQTATTRGDDQRLARSFVAFHPNDNQSGAVNLVWNRERGNGLSVSSRPAAPAA